MRRKLTDRLFCLSEDEFVVLANACGLGTMYGFALERPKPDTSKERYNRAVIMLYQKGLLAFQNDGLVVDKTIEKIFDCFRSARCTLKLIYGDGERAPVCVYPSEFGNAYVQPAADGVGYIRMGVKAAGPLGRFLKEEDYLPAGAATSELVELLEKNGDGIGTPEETAGQIPTLVLQTVLVENDTCRILEKLSVVQSGIREILVTDTMDGNKETVLYTQERFMDHINKMGGLK